jgi:hypothetical protein
MISVAGRPKSGGTGVSTAALFAWHPEHELAPGGAPAAIAGKSKITTKQTAIPAQAGIHRSTTRAVEEWVPAFAGTTFFM